MPNILIADDHDLVREAIAAYLSQKEDFTVQTASSVDECLGMLQGETPFDMAILDFNMPRKNGIDGIKVALSKFPRIKFALMSGVAKPSEAREAMIAGAVGYFPKSMSPETMVNAIRFVLSGEKFFPADLNFSSDDQDKVSEFEGLSSREIETLRGLCAGQSNKEIARDLELQEVTIKLYVKNILQKLGAKNRTHAVILAKDKDFL